MTVIAKLKRDTSNGDAWAPSYAVATQDCKDRRIAKHYYVSCIFTTGGLTDAVS